MPRSLAVIEMHALPVNTSHVAGSARHHLTAVFRAKLRETQPAPGFASGVRRTAVGITDCEGSRGEVVGLLSGLWPLAATATATTVSPIAPPVTGSRRRRRHGGWRRCAG